MSSLHSHLYLKVIIFHSYIWIECQVFIHTFTWKLLSSTLKYMDRISNLLLFPTYFERIYYWLYFSSNGSLLIFENLYLSSSVFLLSLFPLFLFIMTDLAPLQMGMSVEFKLKINRYRLEKIAHSGNLHWSEDRF